MKLQRREKILAAILGALVLLLAAWLLLFSGDARSTSELEAARRRLAAEVDKKEARIQTATHLARRLAEWQRRALPSDPAHARSLYQSWLRQLADRLKFRKLNVDSSGGQPRRDKSTLLSFTLHGRAALPKLVEFLHEFHSAGHLHQIRRMDIKPVENSPELDVRVSVEALSLPGADRKNELTKEHGKTLRLAKLSDYSTAIVARNLLGPPPGQPPDMAQTTFVTAILAADGRGEVWLVDKTSGKKWKLHEGERVQVGSLQGSVQSIGVRDVTLDLGGRVCRYHCGDNLRGGEEVKTP